MKRNSFLICILAVLLLFSCGGRGKTASALPDGDTIPLRYAENLTLVSYPDYTLATLRNPWDTFTRCIPISWFLKTVNSRHIFRKVPWCVPRSPNRSFTLPYIAG